MASPGNTGIISCSIIIFHGFFHWRVSEPHLPIMPNSKTTPFLGRPSRRTWTRASVALTVDLMIKWLDCRLDTIPERSCHIWGHMSRGKSSSTGKKLIEEATPPSLATSSFEICAVKKNPACLNTVVSPHLFQLCTMPPISHDWKHQFLGREDRIIKNHDLSASSETIVAHRDPHGENVGKPEHSKRVSLDVPLSWVPLSWVWTGWGAALCMVRWSAAGLGWLVGPLDLWRADDFDMVISWKPKIDSLKSGNDAVYSLSCTSGFPMLSDSWPEGASARSSSCV